MGLRRGSVAADAPGDAADCLAGEEQQGDGYGGEHDDGEAGEHDDGEAGEPAWHRPRAARTRPAGR